MIFVSILIASVAVLAGLYWLSKRGHPVDLDDDDDIGIDNPKTHPFHDFEPERLSGTEKALRAALDENKKK